MTIAAGAALVGGALAPVSVVLPMLRASSRRLNAAGPEFAAMACVLSAVGLVIVILRPLPVASVAVAAGLVGAIPLLTVGSLPRDVASGLRPHAYPTWWWSLAYAATAISLGLLALLIGSLFAPPRLGSIPGRVEIIVAVDAVLLTLLPSLVFAEGRKTVIFGVAGALASFGGVAGASPTDLMRHPEVVLSCGWVLGMGLLSLATARSATSVRVSAQEPGMEALATLGQDPGSAPGRRRLRRRRDGVRGSAGLETGPGSRLDEAPRQGLER